MAFCTRRMVRGLVCTLAACACTSLCAASAPEISLDQFRAAVGHQRQIAAACAALPDACDASLVDGDVRIAASGNVPAFNQSWDWMRDAVTAARKSTDADRRTIMLAANTRLDEIESQIGASDSDARFKQLRAQANTVLAKSEFQGESDPSWWDKQKARFWSFVARIFGGIQNVGARNIWLWPLFEVLLYTMAAVGLLLILRRSLVRQRQAIALGTGAAKVNAWDKEAEDWAAQAELCATHQQWREAVHCLYWAAIVGLEAQRAWRHNPTRTPREYVRLLKAGSSQQASLRGLTQLLERVWYGLRDATREDYERAQSLFDGLRQKQHAEAA
jgi:hypothetical protein